MALSSFSRVLTVVVAAAALAGAGSAGPAVAATPLAPLTTVAGRVVPGQYIVVLKSGAIAPVVPVTAQGPGSAAIVAVQNLLAAKPPAVLGALVREGRVNHQFAGVLHGFSAVLDRSRLAAVRADPQVAFVEPDQYVSAQATQNQPTWGLDRIDQRALPVNKAYSYARTGAGVNAYIIDSGIRSTHADFRRRVSRGFSAVADGRGTGDCNGHGTHVAGTVGSATYGVAKGVRLVPVRVLDCDGAGTNSAVIAGIDWVTKNRVLPAVANLSLGGPISAALDKAVTASIASGVTYTIAAGNSSSYSCASSPARVPAAITVGAAQANDQTAGFSNWGSCIDLFAPGVNITSTWNSSDSATSTLSGTSMASPHAAGVAALYLQAHPSATPAAVSDALVKAATPNVLSWAILGSPNKLLFSAVP